MGTGVDSGGAGAPPPPQHPGPMPPEASRAGEGAVPPPGRIPPRPTVPPAAGLPGTPGAPPTPASRVDAPAAPAGVPGARTGAPGPLTAAPGWAAPAGPPPPPPPGSPPAATAFAAAAPPAAGPPAATAFTAAGQPVAVPSAAAPPAAGAAAGRPGAGRVAAAVCLVLGLGLLGGSLLGSRLAGAPVTTVSATGPRTYELARTLWEETPVDEIFPRTLNGPDAGPGGADRRWTRIGVDPRTRCSDAAFDPLLARALAPVGCVRLLRATYTDATATNVTTVGVLVVEGDRAAVRALRKRWTDERLGGRADMVPRPYAPAGTPAAGFGDRQRASWTVRVHTGLPFVTYAVSGFADGRSVERPQPAAEAVVPGDTAAPAQAGMGHEAGGLAELVDNRLREAADAQARRAAGEEQR
ncbi:hypothetical protein GCM10010406_17550 [Streptomyces thermolineatus]|uniref:Uncharacterized protein n=1 Tax=Streptomyces thermolineatus TaxID=44033 RepID=A0ABN3LEY7_9ACTN